MACLQRASPALKQILIKLHSDEKPAEIDHHLYEFGSVKYHIQASVSDPQNIYLSLSTPPILPEVLPNGLPQSTLQAVKKVHPDIVEVVEHPEEGFQLTLKLNFAKLPHRRDDLHAGVYWLHDKRDWLDNKLASFQIDPISSPALVCGAEIYIGSFSISLGAAHLQTYCIKVISDISSLQAVILSSQLKETLWSLGSRDISHGMYKPIKLVYHPREPFFVIRMPEKTTAIFPMRFRDDSDVILATAFFQELMDVGSSSAWAKAPPCTWSPIPPPELRGEPFQDLSTNGGFVSFDIFSHHVEGTRLDKTVWSLLNFYAYVKYHVKCTRGFIQRRMRKRLEILAEAVNTAGIRGDQNTMKVEGHCCMKKIISFSKSKILRRHCGTFTKKIMRIHSPIKIQGFDRFRRKWLKIPKFTSLRKYTKLD